MNRRSENRTSGEPLQQVDRTFVLQHGRKLSYFGGCDYFRISSHPAVLAAVHDGLKEFGLNVAASRKTTGNHPLYEKLEAALAAFFGVEAAVLVSNGYMANLVVAQVLAGKFTHALIDERAHISLKDSWRMLETKSILNAFHHRDAESAASAARRLGKSAKIILLTDGLFSHSGQVAPLDDYLRLLPKNTTVLVDDAHGVGTIGRSGRGTVEFLGIRSPRILQTVTLSKAFGAYGGAVLGSRKLCEQVTALSRIFTGNTPLPLPLANAALTAIQIVRSDTRMRRRLLFNTRYVKAALRNACFPVPDGPGPIVPIEPRGTRAAESLKRRLLAHDIHPPFIHYPGGPVSGYFRFVISSEHSAEQLDALTECLATLKR